MFTSRIHREFYKFFLSICVLGCLIYSSVGSSSPMQATCSDSAGTPIYKMVFEITDPNFNEQDNRVEWQSIGSAEEQRELAKGIHVTTREIEFFSADSLAAFASDPENIGELPTSFTPPFWYGRFEFEPTFQFVDYYEDEQPKLVGSYLHYRSVFPVAINNRLVSISSSLLNVGSWIYTHRGNGEKTSAIEFWIGEGRTFFGSLSLGYQSYTGANSGVAEGGSYSWSGGIFFKTLCQVDHYDDPN